MAHSMVFCPPLSEGIFSSWIVSIIQSNYQRDSLSKLLLSFRLDSFSQDTDAILFFTIASFIPEENLQIM